MIEREPAWDCGTFRVDRIVTNGDWKQNCFVVQHVASREIVIIDPGGSPELIDRVASGTGGRVRHVLLTHGHFDHVGGLESVCRRWSLRGKLHSADAPSLRHASLYALRFAGQRIEQPKSVDVFEAPAELHVGDSSIQIVHTPGHTTGSVCYEFPGFAFTGDTLLYERVGRTDLPGGDKSVLDESVAVLLGALPADVVLFPGHGRSWTVEGARRWLDAFAACQVQEN